MEQIRRRVGLALAASAAIVLLAACGGDPDVAPSADSATTTVPTTTTAAPESSSSSSTTSTTSVASTTSSPQTTLVPVDPDQGPAGKTNLPFESFDIPDGFVVLDVSLGERTVVSGYVDNQTGGGLQKHVFWSPTQPFETALPIGSLFDDQVFPPDVTALLELNGISYAFVAGDENALDRQPTMLTSLDGIHWERSSIQTIEPQQVKLALATATPESPPYPGASAVIGAVVADGAIHATGWVTIEGRITGVVWMFDGSMWTEHVLPNQQGGIEYGARIAASATGRIVGLGGPTYAGPGTLISDGSNEWTRVDRGVDATGQEVWGWDQVATNSLFTYRLYHSLAGGGDSLLFWTEDRVQWTPVNLPTGDDIAGDLWLLEASGQHDPIAYEMRWPNQGLTEPARIWILDRSAWLERTFAGTRIVTADETHISTQDDSRLYVYDRRRS